MAFNRVQGGGAEDDATTSSISVTISAVGSGNLICGFVGHEDTPSTLNSVTDDKGNTYNLETAIHDTTRGFFTHAFSRTNITNAPVTITANFSVGTAFKKIIVDEFSGGSTASSDERDGSAHGGQDEVSPGTGTDAVDSGPFTTTINGDLLYGGCIGTEAGALCSNGTSFSAGTTETTTYFGQSEFRTQATAGSGTAATFTQAVDTHRSTLLIAIKPPGGPPPPFCYDYPVPRTVVYPHALHTYVAVPMKQQVVQRPQLMGQMVM